MAVKIRLKRMGAKKSPFYRIVVADSRSPRDGRFIEQVGHYNPVAKPEAEVRIDEELALKWLQTARSHLTQYVTCSLKQGSWRNSTTRKTRSNHVADLF